MHRRNTLGLAIFSAVTAVMGSLVATGSAHATTVPLDAPRYLHVASSDEAAHTIQLGWSAPAIAPTPAGYDVYDNGDRVTGTTKSVTVTLRNLAARKHTFVVKARNAAGVRSSASLELSLWIGQSASVFAPPGTPTPSITDLGGTSVNLSWPASTHSPITGYEVLDTLTRTALPTSTATSTATTTVVSGLLPGTCYSLAVRAIADAVASLPSTAVQVCTPAQPRPANLRVLGVTPTSVRLGWTAPAVGPTPAGYDVYLKEERVTGTTASLSVTVTGLPSGELVGPFTVRARDRWGNRSLPAGPVSATTAADERPPAAPSFLRISRLDSDTIVLSWSAGDIKPLTFSVLANGVQVAHGLADTTATVTGLTADTTYQLEVVATDAAGRDSAPSPSLTAHTSPIDTTIAPVANLRVSRCRPRDSTGPVVCLAGDTPTGSPVTGWDVAIDGRYLLTAVFSSDGPWSLKLANEVAGGSRITVRGHTSAGVETASASVVVPAVSAPDTVPPSAIRSLSASSVGDRDVVLRWSGPPDPDVASYEVVRGSTILATIPATSIPPTYDDGSTGTVSSLTPGTAYTYHVRAIDTAGNKGAAATLTVTTAPGNPALKAPKNVTYTRRPGANAGDPDQLVISVDAPTDGVTDRFLVTSGTTFSAFVQPSSDSDTRWTLVMNVTGTPPSSVWVVAMDTTGHRSAWVGPISLG